MLLSPRLTARLATSLCALAAFAALAIALLWQHGDRALLPCPLCILQRYAYLGLGASAVLAAVFVHRRRIGLTLSALGLLFALAGVIVAARNVWVEQHPGLSCGIDALEVFVNGLPTAQWWPQLFYAEGVCGGKLLPILGLTIPQWSLAGLIALVLVFGVAIWAQRRVD